MKIVVIGTVSKAEEVALAIAHEHIENMQVVIVGHEIPPPREELRMEILIQEKYELKDYCHDIPEKSKKHKPKLNFNISPKNNYIKPRNLRHQFHFYKY